MAQLIAPAHKKKAADVARQNAHAASAADLCSLRQRLPRRFPLFAAFFGFARPAVLAEDFFAAVFFLDFAFARGAGLDLDFFAGFDRDAREGEGAEEPPGRSVTITSSSVSSITPSFSPSSSSICESSLSSPLSCSHAIAPPSIRPLLPWADFAVHTPQFIKSKSRTFVKVGVCSEEN
jgi:hypothetical protein